MIDPRRFDDLARRIQASLPPGLDGVREDVTRNIRAIIAAGIARMDLVEREEFDVQSAVLARTREKLETLERRVRQLEASLEEPGPARKSRLRKTVTSDAHAADRPQRRVAGPDTGAPPQIGIRRRGFRLGAERHDARQEPRLRFERLHVRIPARRAPRLGPTDVRSPRRMYDRAPR